MRRSKCAGIVADSALRFPELARDAISDAADAHGVARGSLLEIGCSVGGTSFRFAERFDRVVAIDLEGQFIRAAADMQVRTSLVCKDQQLAWKQSLIGNNLLATPCCSDAAAPTDATAIKLLSLQASSSCIEPGLVPVLNLVSCSINPHWWASDSTMKASPYKDTHGRSPPLHQ